MVDTRLKIRLQLQVKVLLAELGDPAGVAALVAVPEEIVQAVRDGAELADDQVELLALAFDRWEEGAAR